MAAHPCKYRMGFIQYFHVLCKEVILFRLRQDDPRQQIARLARLQQQQLAAALDIIQQLAAFGRVGRRHGVAAPDHHRRFPWIAGLQRQPHLPQNRSQLRREVHPPCLQPLGRGISPG